MNHDVLELDRHHHGVTERVQISGDPTGTNTITVIRGVSGTTATTTLDTATVVNLIGNSRLGSEVNQTGLTTIGVSPHAILPDLPVPGADRRLGPDGRRR